jgi:hypothetical protein
MPLCLLIHAAGSAITGTAVYSKHPRHESFPLFENPNKALAENAAYQKALSNCWVQAVPVGELLVTFHSVGAQYRCTLSIIIVL